jgi:hypothetical protein
MLEDKRWWESRTLWSLLVALGSIIAAAFGIEIDEQTKKVLITQTTAVMSGIGALVGIVGGMIFRWKAKREITK